MHRGYFALYRKIMDHPFYKEKRVFSKNEAWIDLLLNVQHSDEDQQVLIGNDVFICKYGESLKSKRTWARRWGWAESKARRFFKLLEKMKQIHQKIEGKTTRITILNYSEYDPKRRNDDATMTHKRRNGDASLVTDNNDNNEKHDKKEKTPPNPQGGKYDFSSTAEKIYQAFIKNIQPKRKSKKRSIKNITTWLNRGRSESDLISSFKNYSETMSEDPAYRKDPANFYGLNEDFCFDYLPVNFECGSEKPKQTKKEILEKYGF